VEVPSAGRSRQFDVVHTFKMTIFEVEFEFREKEEVTRTHIRRVCGLWNRWNTLFVQNVFHGDGSVDRERSRHAASKCLDAQFHGQNVVDGLVIKFNSLPIKVNVKRRSDFTRGRTLVTFSSVFDLQGLPERGSPSITSRPTKMLYAT
jgi:hypothetical protein